MIIINMNLHCPNNKHIRIAFPFRNQEYVKIFGFQKGDSLDMIYAFLETNYFDE